MTLAAEEIFGPDPHELVRVAEGRYQFVVPELNTDFEIAHVRRERYHLHAEITVHCGLSGVKAHNRILDVFETNLSSLRDREGLARMLADRTNTASDRPAWAAVVSEMAVRVKLAEDVGAGAVNLRDVARPSAEQFHRVGRLLIPARHPAMFFGDGDSLKTYTGIYLLHELRKQGVRVAVADWELTKDDHRERGELLTGGPPDMVYLHCSRPLVHEADRIGRELVEHQIEYLLLDSAAPACFGRPEDAENAAAYFRVLRTFGIGTLTIAHTNRSEQSDQKPFGSTFWFNLARAIWYVKRADATVNGATEIGLYPRKFNLGAPQRPSALRFTFTDTTTDVAGLDIADVDSLAAKLPLKDRIAHLVRRRARTLEELAEELDSDSQTVARTIRRYSGERAKVQLFTKLPNDRFALMERRAS